MRISYSLSRILTIAALVPSTASASCLDEVATFAEKFAVGFKHRAIVGSPRPTVN